MKYHVVTIRTDDVVVYRKGIAQDLKMGIWDPPETAVVNNGLKKRKIILTPNCYRGEDNI